MGYKWRQIIAEKHELPFVKQEAMKVAGQVLSRPKLYRTAVKAANKAISTLPRVALYSLLNEWGKHREVPDAPKEAFRDWYLERNRTGAAVT